MKPLIILISLFFLYFATVLADTKAKPPRLNNDTKILGLISFKEPFKTYQKISEIGNGAIPSIMKEMEEETGMFLPILENSTNITIVYYFLNNNLCLGYFITVKNKKAFDNIFITSIENKETIENTMIISENKEGLKIFKELLPKINALTLKNDIEINVDLKNITSSFSNELNPDKNINIKNLFDQFEMLTVSFNLTKEPYNQELVLITTENSNLQKMLNQTGLETISLFDLIGFGNMMSSISQLDFSKATPFFIDIIRASQINGSEKEESFKKLKEVEKNTQDILNKIGLVQFASTSNFDKKLNVKEVIKCQNAKILLEDLIAFNKQENTSLFFNYFKDAFDFIQADFLDTNLIFEFETSEKMKGSNVYKLSLKDKDNKNDVLDFNYYITVNENNIFLFDSLPDLKTTIEKVKISPIKNTPNLESFNYFKSGFSSYTDLNLLVILKAFDQMLKHQSGIGLNLENQANVKLKPIKIGYKMDGNLKILYNMDFENLKLIAKVALPLIFFDEILDTEEEEMEEDSPSQP